MVELSSLTFTPGQLAARRQDEWQPRVKLSLKEASDRLGSPGFDGPRRSEDGARNEKIRLLCVGADSFAGV